MSVGTTSLLLPDKVDVWIVAVLSSSRVASWEGAEEGVGEQTCHLLLRHSDGVVHAPLEEGYRLKGGTEAQPRKVKIICFAHLPNETVTHAA